VGTTGIVGETTDQFQAITPYVPHHNRHFVLYAHRLVGGGLVDVFQQRGYILGFERDVRRRRRTTTYITGTPTTITGLSSVTEYYLKLRRNTTRLTERTVRVATTTYYTPTLTALTSTPSSTTQIDLAWDGSFTGVAVIQYHERIRHVGAVFTTLAFTTETAYSLTGLLPATAYYFRAIPQGTTGFSSRRRITRTPPPTICPY
jgi:hypothetical protein